MLARLPGRVSHIYLPSYSSVNSYQSFDESPQKIATFLESRILQHCVRADHPRDRHWLPGSQVYKWYPAW